MPVRNGPRWYGLAALVLVCGSAAAQSNLGFLKDAPLSRFNADDISLMVEAGRVVLNSEEAKPSRSWRNEKTRHSGRITLLQRFSFESRECRRLRVDNRAGGMESSTNLSACRDSAGAWAIDTRAQPTAKR